VNANDVIEAYVTDVAVRLPRRQRNDVAFELRALLHEGLQARAGDEGRAADAAMATEFVRAFGHPADVAARYLPTLTIIDPADGHAFLRATIVGLALIWGLGLLTRLLQPVEPGQGLLVVLGQWWGGTVIASLWWPGLLVVGFGLAAWFRRRSPRGPEWHPRAGDRVRGGRAALALGLAGIVCGLGVLLDPRWLLDVFYGGRAAAAAYRALTYTERFRTHEAPILLALVVLNIPLLLAVMARGRWSPGLRGLERGLALATCAALVWTALDGPVFLTPASDQTFKTALVLIVVFTLAGIGVSTLRSVRPAPN
jgi:hypothetical protein